MKRLVFAVIVSAVLYASLGAIEFFVKTGTVAHEKKISNYYQWMYWQIGKSGLQDIYADDTVKWASLQNVIANWDRDMTFKNSAFVTSVGCTLSESPNFSVDYTLLFEGNGGTVALDTANSVLEQDNDFSVHMHRITLHRRVYKSLFLVAEYDSAKQSIDPFIDDIVQKVYKLGVRTEYAADKWTIRGKVLVVPYMTTDYNVMNAYYSESEDEIFLLGTAQRTLEGTGFSLDLNTQYALSKPLSALINITYDAYSAESTYWAPDESITDTRFSVLFGFTARF